MLHNLFELTRQYNKKSLLEANVEKTWEKFSPKQRKRFVDQMLHDETAIDVFKSMGEVDVDIYGRMTPIDVLSKIDISHIGNYWKTYVEDIFKHFFDVIKEQIDPTPQGKYTPYIMYQMAERVNHIFVWEDIDNVKDNIESFETLKKKRFYQNNNVKKILEEYFKDHEAFAYISAALDRMKGSFSDINSYHNIEDLMIITQSITYIQETKKDFAEVYKRLASEKRITSYLFDEEKNIFCCTLHDYKASQELFQHRSAFCTATGQKKWYDNYCNDEQPLVVYGNYEGAFLQFSECTGDNKNRHDSDPFLSELNLIDPEVVQAWKSVPRKTNFQWENLPLHSLEYVCASGIPKLKGEELKYVLRWCNMLGLLLDRPVQDVRYVRGFFANVDFGDRHSLSILEDEFFYENLSMLFIYTCSVISKDDMLSMWRKIKAREGYRTLEEMQNDLFELCYRKGLETSRFMANLLTVIDMYNKELRQ